ncbi:hypothetical protein [Thiomicrorhabdus sediminis]|uniref:DUF4381 domain-containing protein n=1 Tax=Thiomicrorhabdus sediminis TaxID=2580412 RepID=A0A4P9K415_9GAMM|nr:hypothetical protein [Thiomicrorhabdus sediminis]QCU89200.1 hypothetical protein FE785_00440 [Thiomicrorhabdus sediminis]
MANEQQINAELEQANSAFQIFDIELPAAPGVDWSQWLSGLVLLMVVVALLLLLGWLWRHYRSQGSHALLVLLPCSIRLFYLKALLAAIARKDASALPAQLYRWHRLVQTAFASYDDKQLSKHVTQSYQSLEKTLFAKRQVDAQALLRQAQELMARISVWQLFKSDFKRLQQSLFKALKAFLSLRRIAKKADIETDRGVR